MQVRAIINVFVTFIPLTGSKTPPQNSAEAKVGWDQLSVKARGSTNNQWGMNKTPLIKVHFIRDRTTSLSS